MNLFQVGLTLSSLGGVLLGVTVLMVHASLAHDHKIDRKVVNVIHQEQVLGYTAIFLIIIGYVLQML